MPTGEKRDRKKNEDSREKRRGEVKTSEWEDNGREKREQSSNEIRNRIPINKNNNISNDSSNQTANGSINTNNNITG